MRTEGSGDLNHGVYFGMKKLFGKTYAYLEELGYLTPIGFVTVFMPMIGSTVLILGAQPLGHWLRGNWEIGMPLFLFGVLFCCGLTLLPTNVVGIIAGWAFSFYLGSRILIVGVVGAASVLRILP